jgi:hypothetical protein
MIRKREPGDDRDEGEHPHRPARSGRALSHLPKSHSMAGWQGAPDPLSN